MDSPYPLLIIIGLLIWGSAGWLFAFAFGHVAGRAVELLTKLDQERQRG